MGPFFLEFFMKKFLLYAVAITPTITISMDRVCTSFLKICSINKTTSQMCTEKADKKDNTQRNHTASGVDYDYPYEAYISERP